MGGGNMAGTMTSTNVELEPQGISGTGATTITSSGQTRFHGGSFHRLITGRARSSRVVATGPGAPQRPAPELRCAINAWRFQR
jgi:hypothetical protein